MFTHISEAMSIDIAAIIFSELSALQITSYCVRYIPRECTRRTCGRLAWRIFCDETVKLFLLVMYATNPIKSLVRLRHNILYLYSGPTRYVYNFV